MSKDETATSRFEAIFRPYPFQLYNGAKLQEMLPHKVTQYLKVIALITLLGRFGAPLDCRTPENHPIGYFFEKGGICFDASGVILIFEGFCWPVSMIAGLCRWLARLGV